MLSAASRFGRAGSVPASTFPPLPIVFVRRSTGNPARFAHGPTRGNGVRPVSATPSTGCPRPGSSGVGSRIRRPPANSVAPGSVLRLALLTRLIRPDHTSSTTPGLYAPSLRWTASSNSPNLFHIGTLETIMKTKITILGLCAVAVAALLGVFTTNVSATEASAKLAPCCDCCGCCTTGSCACVDCGCPCCDGGACCEGAACCAK